MSRQEHLAAIYDRLAEAYAERFSGELDEEPLDRRLLDELHAGAGEVHADEFLDQPVSIDATLYEPDEMAAILAAAGLAVDAAVTRPPIEDLEHPTTRAYVRASRPG